MSTRGTGLPGYITAATTFGVAGGGNIASFSFTLRCVYCGGAVALIQLYREVKKAWIAKRQENLSEGCVRKRATLRRALRTGCMSAIRRYRSGKGEFPKVKDTTSIPRGLLLNRYSRRAG